MKTTEYINDNNLAGHTKRIGILFHCGRDLVAACHVEAVIEAANYNPPGWEEPEKDELRLRIVRLGKLGMANTGRRGHRWQPCCPLKPHLVLEHALEIMAELRIAGDAAFCSTPCIRMIWERCGRNGNTATALELDDTRRIMLNFRKKGLLKLPPDTPLFGDER